jgi:hypothetical protein
MGTYHWIAGAQGKALENWRRSIRCAEDLGARPELARTYAEVGGRLGARRSTIRQLDNVLAGEYVEKARVLLEELGLDRDLASLEAMAG